MPRKLRVEYPGGMYHLMSRGDRREDIYLDDVDRQDFIKTRPRRAKRPVGRVHAYCLMRNHYQMLEKMEDKLGEHHSGGYGWRARRAKLSDC